MPAWTAATQTCFRCLLLAVAACLTHAGVAGADDPGSETVRIDPEGAAPAEERGWHYTPLQISLFPVAEIFPADWTVTGLSFNVIYGEQSEVFGFDVGIFNNVTTRLTGLQAGLVNVVDGEARGFQFGLINRVDKRLNGAQIGIGNNVAEIAYGAQLGIVNQAGSVTGVQLGAVNFTDTLRGVQIGVLNVNRAGKPLPFLPLMNIGW